MVLQDGNVVVNYYFDNDGNWGGGGAKEHLGLCESIDRDQVGLNDTLTEVLIENEDDAGSKSGTVGSEYAPLVNQKVLCMTV